MKNQCNICNNNLGGIFIMSFDDSAKVWDTEKRINRAKVIEGEKINYSLFLLKGIK